MKNLIFALGIFILISSCRKEARIVSCDLLKQKNKLVYLNDTLYSGFCEIYKDTLLLVSRSYKEGKKDGEWKEYFNNGSLRYIGYCKNNELHGKFLEYNPNGILIKKGYLKEGFREGKWEYFDGNGEKIKTEFYKDKNLLSTN